MQCSSGRRTPIERVHAVFVRSFSSVPVRAGDLGTQTEVGLEM
jgi:hypothetical protein